MKFDPDTGKPISLEEQVQKELMSFFARASMALMVRANKTDRDKEDITEYMFSMALEDAKDIIEIVGEAVLHANESLRD